MGKIGRFLSFTRRERKLICEAGILLVISNLCIRTIAFRHIYTFLNSSWIDCSRSPGDSEDDIKLINLSVSRASKSFPWTRACLSKSIAAFIMLRRRGIPAMILAGARFNASSLFAHAWLCAGRGEHYGNDDSRPFVALISVGHEASSIVKSVPPTTPPPRMARQ